MNFEDLNGLVMKDVRQIENDRLEFECVDGRTFALFHDQDCCENVVIESVFGDLSDLVGVPILLAEEATSKDDPQDVAKARADERTNSPDTYYDEDSQTWTFYKLRTIKGSVDIRWHGTSNGYYSESVTFAQIDGPQ